MSRLQIAALEKEVRERSQKDTQKEQQEAERPIINPLMITNGPYNPAPQAIPNGTGMQFTGVPPVRFALAL